MLLIQYTLIYASVLIFVAMGGMFSERSGVINLGLEGIMVMGALGGAFVLYSLPVGTPALVIILLTILASVLFGMLYSLFLAVAAINFKADQTLVGTAMNMLATAAAVVIVKAFNNARSGGTNPSAILDYIANRKVFLIGDFNIYMILTVILVAAAYVILKKTRFGLRLMACGEHPQAADSLGINVYKMRYSGVLISGFCGGIGGIIWIVSAVGGFTIDTYLLYRRQLEQQWAMMGFQMTAPAFELVEDASGRRRLVESERTVRRYGLRRG